MRADYIKPSVYTRIYHLMEYENALALRLSLETGLRIGDCLALRPEDIDGCVISYTAQKTGKSGKKKISADLAKRLRKIGDNLYSLGVSVINREPDKLYGKMSKKPQRL